MVPGVRLRRAHFPPLAGVAPYLPGPGAIDHALRDQVAAILADVAAHGDAALVRYQRALDGVDLAPAEWEVPRAAWRAARRRLSPAVLGALERAAARVRAFHECQRSADLVVTSPDGTRLAAVARPLDRVGAYVPGGTAAYPSTVLMTVIPAVVAGVREVIVVTPPGRLGDVVLAACDVAGASRVFRLGGAQACAALAWGTATVPPVDKIVGPGNRYVAEAKRQLAGVVGIDLIAGPTEVLIIADATAPPALVAADLLAQAEHDADAIAWLVTPGAALADAVERELARQLAGAPRAAIARAALARRGLVVLTPDLAAACALANRVAPEHLELLVAAPSRWLSRIHHAGAVFLGPHTPAAVGDYVAGPSHVLPTGGSARFASALGVRDFVRQMSVIAYSPARLAQDAADVVALAEAEGLPAHAASVRARTAVSAPACDT